MNVKILQYLEVAGAADFATVEFVDLFDEVAGFAGVARGQPRKIRHYFWLRNLRSCQSLLKTRCKL
jgi:hypothetical protein